MGVDTARCEAHTPLCGPPPGGSEAAVSSS